MTTATPISIRRVRPSDEPGLVDFYARLSDSSRYARFMGLGDGLSAGTARSFCTPDHMHAEGYVAISGGGNGDSESDGAAPIIGHLCLEPVGRRRLELAIAVDDRAQGEGIGRRLFEAALDWALSHHIEAIIASAFANNARVLRLLTSAPYPVHTADAGAGVVDVVIPLKPELLPDQPIVLPPELLASRRMPRGRGPMNISRCSRVVWRGRRPPGRGAAG